MRVLRATFAIGAVTLAAVSCAAVAGLDHFEVVACPDGCDAGAIDARAPVDGSQIVTLPDGAIVVIGPDFGPPDDAGVDAGAGDSGTEPLDGAIPIVPDCLNGTCPSTLGATCSAEPCTSTPVWQNSADGGGPSSGGVQIQDANCRAVASPSQQDFLSSTLADAGSPRYELAFRVLIVRFGPMGEASTLSTIMQLRFGNTVALTLEKAPGELTICNATSQCQTAAVNDDAEDFRFEVYATAGSQVTAGFGVLATGQGGGQGCGAPLTVPLTGPLLGEPSVDFGCIATNNICDVTFDDAVFSATSF